MNGSRPIQGGGEAGSAELRRILSDLRRSRLDADEWGDVAGALARLDTSSSGPTEPATTLSNLAFRGRVRRRLDRGRVEAPAVAPTKPTPALPIVGGVCAAILLALGWAIGGPVVLAATAFLAVFVLGVAVAGTHTVANRRRRSAPADPTTVSPPPPAVAAELDRHLRALGSGASDPGSGGSRRPGPA